MSVSRRFLGIAAALLSGALSSATGAQEPPKEAARGAFQRTSDEELKKVLTPLQYFVTQKAGTERAYANDYWNDHRSGIYVDVVSGEPLFSSLDKYDSGTGWPSFTRPLEGANVKRMSENASTLAAFGVEVRSAAADSHLGHVFADDPPPAGLRCCINSAALRFIPKEKLAESGYGKYEPLFGTTKR